LAALTEKKMLMKQCVAAILVDRDAKVAWCYVRRVPTVNPVLARVYNRIERGHKAQTARQAIAERAVVGIRSGGDRNIPLPTTENPLNQRFYFYFKRTSSVKTVSS